MGNPRIRLRLPRPSPRTLVTELFSSPDHRFFLRSSGISFHGRLGHTLSDTPLFAASWNSVWLGACWHSDNSAGGHARAAAACDSRGVLLRLQPIAWSNRLHQDVRPAAARIEMERDQLRQTADQNAGRKSRSGSAFSPFRPSRTRQPLKISFYFDALAANGNSACDGFCSCNKLDRNSGISKTARLCREPTLH
jgi:hypothetical protein